MLITTEYPDDLIPMQEAEKLSGYSRTWIRNRLRVWWQAGKQAVSKSELEQAVKDFETPKLAKDDKNEKGD